MRADADGDNDHDEKTHESDDCNKEEPCMVMMTTMKS